MIGSERSMTGAGLGRGSAAGTPGGPADDATSLRSLRRRWWWLVAFSVTALLVTAALLLRSGLDAALWLATAAPTLAWLLALTGARLEEHRRIDGQASELLSRFGPGTTLSLARAVVLALFAGFLLLPRPEGALAWLPMALYTVFVVGDFFDGLLARRSGTATMLGARLDLELDSLGTLAVVIVALRWGQLPEWYLLVGAARFLFLLGPLWRRRRGLPVHDLPPSRNRRLWAGFQMGFLSAVLWPIVPPAAAHLAAWCFGLPFLLGFLRDAVVVTGQADADSPSYRRWQRRWRDTERWLPPLLRGALLAVVWGWLREWPAPLAPSGWESAITMWGWPAAGFVASAGAAAFLLGSSLVVAGLLARLGALLTTFGFVVEIAAHGATPEARIGLVSALGVLLVGSGALSLWQPEEEALRRQAGRTRALSPELPPE